MEHTVHTAILCRCGKQAVAFTIGATKTTEKYGLAGCIIGKIFICEEHTKIAEENYHVTYLKD